MFGIDFDGHPDLAQPLPARRVRGVPAAQGLPAAGPDREAVARHRRRRAHARRGPGRRGRGRERPTRRPTHDRRSPSASSCAYIAAAGRRRPGQRRARDRGHDPQHGPAAPGHPRHAAHRRQARRRAGRRGRAGRRLHAPRLREADRGPHLPAGHHAGQPHRLGRQLRQRGAVHPRRRAADGDRGAAPGAVHPHGAVRDEPDRQHHAVRRRHGPPARRLHGRPSTPSATASSSSTRSRRPPAGASTRTSTASAASRTTCPRAGSTTPRPPWRKVRDFCDEMDDLVTGNEIFETRTRGIGVIPADVALSYGLSGANLRASGVDWDLRRDGGVRRPRPRPARLEGHHPPRRRLLRPLLGAGPGDPRGDQDRRPVPRRPARRPDHGQGAPHHQGARGRGLRRDREPARRHGLLRRSRRATSARSG